LSLSLPDEVRAALTEAGLSDDQMLVMIGDELIERLGPRIVYDLAAALTEQGRTLAKYAGRGNQPAATKRLRSRNLDILRLWLVERRSLAEIGREAGLSRSRVDQILKGYFGVHKRRAAPRNIITVPAAALDVMREALLELLTGCMEDMATEARTPKFPETLAAFDLARSLLADVGWEPRDPEVDVELYLGRGREGAVVKALRENLDTQRYLTDTHDDAQRERAEAAVTTVELLLTVVER
jgi:DNA-binding CsgD family transcriptional regulator